MPDTFTFDLRPPVKKMCDNCPFNPASTMAYSLGEERMQGIKDEPFFPCHKTTEVTKPIEEFDQRLPLVLQYQQCRGHKAYRDKNA